MTPSMRTSSSIASCDGDNIESGYSSNSSHDEISSLNSSSSASPQEMVIMVSKWTNNGKASRRRSHYEQLRHRRSKASCLSPQLPSFSSTSTSSSPLLKDIYHHIPTIATSSSALLLFLITIFTISHQHTEIESMRLQLEISNQHRAHLEKSATDLQSKVTSREAALIHCNDAHLTLSKHHKDQSGKVRELQEELAELRQKFERLVDGNAERKVS
ncbi:hypothetical protein ACHAXA_000846 [Cyclostephanos tholiformis]|uniref:Uncharacterized protein n=1 Tax=Cyclostephanos tholiformis TaxID=382380 RepID=A0ABD3SRH7_9STRA